MHIIAMGMPDFNLGAFLLHYVAKEIETVAKTFIFRCRGFEMYVFLDLLCDYIVCKWI